MKMEVIEEKIKFLREKNPKIGCAAMDSLIEKSRDSNEVYPYFDYFLELSEDENSYVRTRGLLLIAANAKWDVDNKIDEAIDGLLKHIMDVKPITSRQFIKALPEIARYKPDLAEDIKIALRSADTEIYKDSMQPLVYKDIQKSLGQIE